MSTALLWKTFALFPLSLRYLLGELAITSYLLDVRMIRDYIYGILATKTNYSNEYISKVKSLKNRHRNRRCFILGNGPSLKHTELDHLRNEISFGSNGIFHIFKESEYRPTYYTVVDFVFARNHYQIINKIIKQEKITGIFCNSLRKYIKGYNSIIWVNFLPTWANGHYSQYTEENLTPFVDNPLLPEFSEELVRGIYDAGTVTYINLQLALYMGFKEIYLIGVDHNYKIEKTIQTEQKDILISDYDVDPNHFSPDYTPKGHQLVVPQLHLMERAYYQARKAAEARNVKIFNATKGGNLRVFKRADYDSLF